jgi:hypothetical protein
MTTVIIGFLILVLLIGLYAIYGATDKWLTQQYAPRDHPAPMLSPVDAKEAFAAIRAELKTLAFGQFRWAIKDMVPEKTLTALLEFEQSAGQNMQRFKAQITMKVEMEGLESGQTKFALHYDVQAGLNRLVADEMIDKTTDRIKTVLQATSLA